MSKQPVLTPQAEDFPRWYQDVIAKAELAENGPVRGTMVIRPWAFAIWERIQAAMDKRIKEAGAENAYFPLFIPDEFLRREAEHVEGFSPELAIVTHGGGKQLEEPVVVRPTSETIINHYFAKWVQSHRDLPMLINQWCNVVRWELRPRLFLRTSEFLWQEGHTAHATEQDARDYALRILHDAYYDTIVNIIGVPVLLGRKTEDEKFAGATTSWALESMMRDGKALQMGTSHELGQNFAKAFGTQYLSAEGTQTHVWQTSWGSSTRMMGGLIMTHGDDKGLRLPPALAPHQVVVMLVRGGDGVTEHVERIHEQLTGAGVRSRIDERLDTSFGRRVTDWELKGVPVRIEVGPRDLEQDEVTVVRRDTSVKTQVSVHSVASTLPALLEDIQRTLLHEATAMRDAHTSVVTSVEDAVEAGQTGFARIPYELLKGDAMRVLTKHAIGVRCLQNPDGSLPLEVNDDVVAVVGRSY